MKFCSKCGKPVEEGEKFCRSCGAPLTGAPREAEPAREEPSRPRYSEEPLYEEEPPRQSAPRQRQKPRLTAPAMLTEGEVILKNYEVTNGFVLPFTAKLTVTNKRLMLHSKGIFSESFQETPVSDVGTIHQSKGLRFVPAPAISALCCFVISGILGKVSSYISVTGLCVLLVFVGLGLLFFAVKPTSTLSVKTGKAAGSGIECGDPNTKGIALDVLGWRRGRDFDTMREELGALVMDLQTLGDNAIPMWKD